jgi:16S rRNA (cytidine1402-2'-O)-methyltransferase
MHKPGVVYLIPSVLDETGRDAIPGYIFAAVKKCHVFFAENLRTSRRYLKTLWPQIVIDDYEWYISEASQAHRTYDIKEIFRQKIKAGKVIGIISEAGCPGIADPGQQLVAIAHELNAEVIPLVGPNSIILALMASGLNGQHFRFAGYLPVKEPARTKTIKELEAESQKKNCTQIFIETPYRNNQLIDVLLKTCKPSTWLCIAVNLTGEKEWIKTKTIADWQKNKPDIHKKPAIFLLLAG